MNELQELLNKLAAMHASLKERGNAALKEAQPIDAAQLQGPILCALREFEWAMSSVKDMVESMNEIAATMPKVEAEIQATVATAETAAVAAAVEAGTLIKKEDVDAQLVAARADEKTKIEQIVAAEKAEQVKASERRAAAVEEHGAAAQSLRDEDLLAENYQERIKAFAGRVTALEEVKVTAETCAASFNHFTSLPLDEQGDKVFATSLNGIKAAVKASAPAGDEKPGAKKGDRPEFLNASNNAASGGSDDADDTELAMM